MAKRKQDDDAAPAEELATTADQAATDAAPAGPPPPKKFAVNFKHSLLGERIVAADTPEEAVAAYKALCDGFKSEHPAEVRELKPPAESEAPLAN